MIQYVDKVYVSYAWGDQTTEDGTKRERIVDLLCTSLNRLGIQIGRDKNNIKPGGSIQAFASEIARSKRIIAVLSEKSLKSKYCMVYELFQAYRRCNFDRDEFRAKVVALVLDDAKPYLESDSGIKSIVEFWKDQCKQQRATLEEKDPKGFSQDELSWLQAMEEMTQRLASMIAVINDSVMPRGFNAICDDNFSDVLARLTTESKEKESGATATALDARASELADSVGQSIVDRFMRLTLEMNEKEVSECYEQAAGWITSGGTHASKPIRASVLLWMSKVVQDNEYLRHLGLVVARVHLADANELLRNIENPYLQARSLANAALIERRIGESSSCFEALSQCEHEIAIATRIALLLERKDVSAAVEIADNHVLSERWAEQAAMAYIAAKRDNDAIEACQFLRSPRFGLTRYYRCLFQCAQAYVIRCQGEPGQGLTPAAMSPVQIEDHQQSREILEPILSKIRSAGRISTGIERESASLRFRIAHLLGEDSVSDWANLLTTFHPLHLDVLNAMRWGVLEAKPSLLADLRAENANDVATLVSCVEMDVFRRSDWEAGLGEVENLANSDVNTEQAERMADIAFQVAAFGPDELKLRSTRLMRSLVGAKHRCFAMLEAKNALQQEDFVKAEKIVREIVHDGDPDCLSLLAMAMEGQGKSEEALEHLDELCEVTGHPQALWRAYHAVVATGQRDRVEPLLQRLCRFSSERVQAMELLVNLYFEQNEDESLRKVIPLLRNLAEIAPSEHRYHVNHALALRGLGELDEAIAVAKRTALQHPDCLELQLLRSQLLVHCERAGDAFSVLDSQEVKERFWENRNFLRKYIDLAYRTGNEVEAHQALLQLRRIEADIPEDERYVQARSTEQLIEFLKGQREFRDDLDTQIAKGKLPWSIPVHVDRVPVTAAMAYRTQDLIVGESVSWRARYTTYASNGFVVGKRDEIIGAQFVRPIAPSEGQTIVGDLTSLVTLFRLGVLEEAVAFFGKVLIPSIYRDYEARDASRLQPHQKSRSDQTKSLVDKIHRGILRSHTGQLPDDATIVDIDPDDNEAFLPGDVVQWLVDAGTLTTKRRDQLLKTFDLPRSSNDGFETARSTRRLYFTAEAVRSLDSAGVLDDLVDATDICLSATAVDSLKADEFAFEHQASQLRENRRFWQAIRDLDEIEFAEVELMDDGEGDRAIHGAFNLSLSAMKLASDRKLPLMVDDRTLLSAASNSAEGATDSAFASFDVIERLRRDGKIEQDEALSHFRKLMRWRYRFHILDSDVLLFAIKNYRRSSSVVGKPLEEIARYVQGCMHDRSLHGGNSETVPPRSIAFELYTKWMRVTADLAVSVMQDEDFAEEEVSEIVNWLIAHLAPNVPLTAPAEQQVSMANNVGRLFLTHILCRLSREPRDKRSRFLISVVREQFNFSNLDFHQTVSDVVEGYRSLDCEAESDDAKTWRNTLAAMRRLTVRHALSDKVTEDGYTLDAHSVAQLESTGAIRAKLDRVSLSDAASEALGNPNSDLRMPESPQGALFFHCDREKNPHVFPLLDLLTFQDADTRAAAIQYFLEPELEANGVIAKRTTTVIKQCKRKSLAKTAKTWYPAMLKIEIAMRRDWQLNLAGFRQSLRTKENDWISPFWSACTCPDIYPAHSVPRQAFFAATDPDWIDKQIEQFAALPNVEQSIQFYINHFKHLPLESPRSLADLLRMRKPSKPEWQRIIDVLLPLASGVNYLTAFQCCRALAGILDHATDSQKSQVADAVGRFIELSLASEIEHPSQRHWIALQHFATHFARWLMFYGPQLSHNNTTSLAWWLADRLAEVVAEDIEASSNPKIMTERLLKRNIHNLMQDTHLVAQFNGLDTDGSFFHLNTLQPVQGGPFLFSLLTERSDDVKRLLDDLCDSTVEEIVKWAHIRGVRGLASHETENALMFQSLEDKLQHCIAVWEDQFDEKQLTEIKGIRDSQQSLADVSFVDDLLEQFHTLEPNFHAYWFAQLRHECWRKTLAPDQFLKYFSNQQSRQLFARSLDNDSMDSLLTLLFQLSNYADTNYVEQLPYLLLNLLDDVTKDEQKQFIVHAIIRVSVGTQAFSAVEHLLKRRSDPQIEAQLELEANYTDYIRFTAPDWAWSLIRPLHQMLRWSQ
ncbi:TIR domain-containing protein [Novipirellula caenicola]|uniref:TIR domain-containing protein n=1 Tax=Novipirellula caenicola TaxID=1536901 RepID=A0ABP9VW04_9BACT